MKILPAIFALAILGQPLVAAEPVRLIFETNIKLDPAAAVTVTTE